MVLWTKTSIAPLKRGIWLLLLFIYMELLTGCGPVTTPAITHYTLSPNLMGMKAVRTRSHTTLLVTTPIAEPGYSTAGIAYTLKQNQLNYYVTHRWVAPPAQLLLPDMVTALQKTKRFSAVVGAPYSGVVHYQLNTRLIQLIARFVTQHPVMQLKIQADLIRSQRSRILASKVFNIKQVIKSKDPASAVLAANQAVAMFLKQLTRFVIHHT